MSPTPEPPQTKKRESRAGARKVTSLSAEQLERKRANDREAQRTIRQRTREHIERLEHQVAELKVKGDRFDEIVRRNTAMEMEIRSLRHQLAMVTSRQGHPGLEGSYSTPSGSMLPSPHLPDSLGLNPASRAPSVLSTSSRTSIAPEWQSYGSTRTSSVGEPSDTNYGARLEPYIYESQMQATNPLPVASAHISYNPSVCAQPAQPPDSGFQSYPQTYHPEAIRGFGHESSHNQQSLPSASGQRSMSVPANSSEREASGYPVVHAPQQYHEPTFPSHPAQPRNEYSYDWTHHQS
ncbi:uncharacterized protein BO97DRAFT_72891 [Aspergillus homomorphus CBS 101889]|uniref:BZIP domain-containing protein n=1 Tax=Aspergillus homomorphus (strain CBS 101889) TaxID=1450537 RepID=A0A395I9P4_ASPHC|nr:hypothetical protein BO97DRAFT_72891 [Aspergillus homomorphus CBS 101889]RAL16685.1 hypothetical protein BO97DRAFT_72891 [Aspergillus homomorphus CBS 101889]